MALGNVSADAQALFSHIDNSVSKSVQILNPTLKPVVIIHGHKAPVPEALKDPRLVAELFHGGYLTRVKDHLYEIPEGLRSKDP
jgi:hypothetical protein